MSIFYDLGIRSCLTGVSPGVSLRPVAFPKTGPPASRGVHAELCSRAPGEREPVAVGSLVGERVGELAGAGDVDRAGGGVVGEVHGSGGDVLPVGQALDDDVGGLGSLGVDRTHGCPQTCLLLARGGQRSSGGFHRASMTDMEAGSFSLAGGFPGVVG